MLREGAKTLRENHWIQHFNAALRTPEGERDVPIPPYSERANCFCALGAMERAIFPCEDDPGYDGLGALGVLAEVMGGAQSESQPEAEEVITGYNDCPKRTKDEVLDRFDRAIEKELAEPNRAC